MPQHKTVLKPIIPKPLWRIMLNFSCAVEIHYIHAYSQRQAFEIIFRRVAKQHNVPIQYVRGLFNGAQDNFGAEIDKEWMIKTGYKY